MHRFHPLPVDPRRDLSGVEADEFADLHERDPPFGHQPADEDDLDPQPLRHRIEAEKRGTRRVRALWWVRTSPWSGHIFRARRSAWPLLTSVAVVVGCAWSAGPAAAATPAAVLAPGLVAEASSVAAGTQTAVPADGRLRGEDFTATVSMVSWPQSVAAPSGIAYVAGSGRRLVDFTLSVTQPTDDSGLLNAPTSVTAVLDVGAASVPVAMTTINQQIAGGTSGSAETTGTDSFVASVPAVTHDVALVLYRGRVHASRWTCGR